MVEWIPSAPTTRSYTPVVPSEKRTRFASPSSSSAVTERPSRTGTSTLPARRASWSAARRIATQVATPLPVAANVDVRELAPTVVEKPLPHDRVRTRSHVRPDPELVERPDAVARQVQASTPRLPLAHPLDDLGLDLPPPDCPAER